MVMKGAVCATADLMRNLKTPVQLEYVKASSYGQNGVNSGKLTLVGIENLDLKGKNVLLVDDILDTGNTMTNIIELLKEKQPKTIKSFVAFVKKVDRKTSYLPDYALFEIENRFIVGYGLDYKERYRGLSGIYEIQNVK
jgi:hypoxanthine phosphoribosyltransferase